METFQGFGKFDVICFVFSLIEGHVLSFLFKLFSNSHACQSARAPLPPGLSIEHVALMSKGD